MIRGWCPSLFEPMQSGDGLLVRVKPRAGGLDADTLRGVVDASVRFGNGVLNLTGRANLQLRGLAEETLPGLAAALLALGAADADPAAERRRNLVTSPLAGDDPRLAPATLAVARALESGLAATPGGPALNPLDALPGKFGFLVDGGDLGSLRADIALRCSPDACFLRLDGGTRALSVRPDEAAAAALSLARAFVALAPAPDASLTDDAPRHAPRMRDLVLARGEAAIFAAAGLPAPCRAEGEGSRPAPPGTLPGPGPDPAPDVGPLRHPGTDRGALAAAAAFGQVDAAALHALAALAERFGDGRVRLSPWRTLLVAGVAARDLSRLADACAALGLIVAAGDPRLSITTCPGRPACRSGEADTRRDAPALAALLASPGPHAPIHLSGCAKGCAHPGPAPLTLVGEPGGYGVSRDARASDPPQNRAVTVAAAWAWAQADATPAPPSWPPGLPDLASAAPHPGTAP